jgi:hypothetical protein
MKRKKIGTQFIVRARTLFLMALILVSSNIGRATTVKTLDLPDLVQQAEIIADVVVTSVQPYWASPSGGNAIRTKVTFSLNRPALKGQVNPQFSLDFLGGAVGNRKMVVPGMPQFAVGQRLILFSYGPNNAYASPIIGFNQGAIRVIRDEQNNVERVYRWWGQPINASQPFNSPAIGMSVTLSPDQVRSADTVDQFLQRITQLVNR